MPNQHSPDPNRMSTLSAMVLLALALTRLIPVSEYMFDLEIFGIKLSFDLDLNLVMVVMAAGLAAAGMDWLLRSHPLMKRGRTIEHWLLPMLTTFILGVPLYLLTSGSLWWSGFAVGSVILVLTFWAEYIVVSPGDTNYPTATAMLTVISFALYLILAIALRYISARLLWLAPALLIATFLTSLRTLHLRLGGHWKFAWAAGIALINVQLAAGLHYWSLTPVGYGLLLLGPLYALISLAASIGEGTPLRRALVEPLVMLGLIWGVGIWLR